MVGTNVCKVYLPGGVGENDLREGGPEDMQLQFIEAAIRTALDQANEREKLERERGK